MNDGGNKSGEFVIFSRQEDKAVNQSRDRTEAGRSWTIFKGIAFFLLCPLMFACTEPLSTREKGALGGTALGAGAGAIIGAMTGATLIGAAIGAAAGGLGGGVIGDQMEGQQKQEAELQQQVEQQHQQVQAQQAEIERLKNEEASAGDRPVVKRKKKSAPRKTRVIY